MLMLKVPPESAAVDAEAPAIDQIMGAVRRHLGMDVCFVSEFFKGRRVFRHVECADGKRLVEVGASDPLEDSYCHWVAQGVLPQLIRDPMEHSFARQLPVTRTLPVGAHLSVPIHLRDGSLFGTFCCFSTAPDQSLTDRDLATMRSFADLAAIQIQKRIDEDSDRQRKLARIRSAIVRRDLDILFQPAVRIDSPQIAFVEALARFRSAPYRPPDDWFAEAHEVGLGTELEMLAAAISLEHLPNLPDSTPMSINISPDALVREEMLALLVAAPLDRLIVEVTEHRAVPNYPALTRALAPLRKRGLKLAVDDAGAGYASLKHILQIRPDIIKLDMSLSRGIERDPVRKALAAALIHFAKAIGSELVAEGVESPAELSSLRELGIAIVQGHLFARPCPIGDLELAAAGRA